MLHRSRSRLFPIVVVLAVCALGWVGWKMFRDMSAPTITLTPNQEQVSPTLPLTVTAEDAKSPIKRIRVSARKGDAVLPVAEKTYDDGAHKQSLTFTMKDTGINDAAFELIISASDDSFGGFGRGNSEEITLPMRIDVSPPRIAVKSSVPYVRRGGTGCVVYSVSKETTQTGVKVGELFFPGYRQDNGDYIAFFAFPYQLENKDFSPQIMAVDLAGNSQANTLNVNRINRIFKSDSINLDQSFLDAKANEFALLVPGQMSNIQRFLEVNGRVRRENAQTLLEIGKNSFAEILWDGPFLRLPDAAPRAGFADHRTYMWEGKEVDQQTHLGLDLASLAQSAVPASNNGTVVFAGYLGIYGNLVVLDHGLGLQSLYSHLTDHQVTVGQTVQKGDIIGHTGATGMAGGDHLHFGILISGVEVTPIEWLDSHWIRDNVSDRILAAGGKAPKIVLSTPPPAAPPAKKAQPPRRSGGSGRSGGQKRR